ncbi:hypothetical protein VEx25_A1424 [Vibrio antiquarius]|uniref:Uncharacterized protein n=1 Tax=Vibrio antiquarius (strain Ex25) TaxID=150340 RepID=A0ABM9WZM0_VIBAE|nr:hypothetical protein VEx25_A1424 [Vibrio antiquarius]EMD80819.1 hypothetical protein C408_0878 [Vibrio diabolicus E0666]
MKQTIFPIKFFVQFRCCLSLCDENIEHHELNWIERQSTNVF